MHPTALYDQTLYTNETTNTVIGAYHREKIMKKTVGSSLRFYEAAVMLCVEQIPRLSFGAFADYSRIMADVLRNFMNEI